MVSIALLGVAAVAIAVVVYLAGAVVGYRRDARAATTWEPADYEGDDYYR